MGGECRKVRSEAGVMEKRFWRSYRQRRRGFGEVFEEVFGCEGLGRGEVLGKKFKNAKSLTSDYVSH